MTIGADDPPAVPDNRPPSRWASWVKFLLRWGIAVVGIAWVVNGLTIRDRAYVLASDDAGRPAVLDVALEREFDPDRDAAAVYEDPATGEAVEVPADRLLNGPDKGEVTLTAADGTRYAAELAAVRLVPPPETAGREALPGVAELFVYTPELLDGDRVLRVDPADVAGGYRVRVPQPIVRTGLGGMVRDARPVLLALSVLVFPVTLICTGLRWWRLTLPLGLGLGLGRAYTLNMVGLFYNTFMLGSTGGDFVKAYYAAKNAPAGRRAAAWMSVFVDRVAGLLVLVLMGGTAATIQYAITPDGNSPVAVACLQVAWASAAILLASVVGTFVLLHAPTRKVLRRKTGLGRVIERTEPLPDTFRGRIRTRLREVFESGQEVAEAYRRRPRSVVEACVLTVPVHLTTIVSAMLAGAALGLPIPWPYYFVCVPVIILAASMPVSPQGAGVMEFFAVTLTRPQGATVAEAFALALCIRAVQILWNLTGGLLVLRGGYGTPRGSAEPAGERGTVIT